MNDEKAYQFGKSRLIIKFGDLTSAVTDVIVSSDDAYLSMGGGVSASILRAGGDVIARDARKNVPCQMGDVVVTVSREVGSKICVPCDNDRLVSKRRIYSREIH